MAEKVNRMSIDLNEYNLLRNIFAAAEALDGAVASRKRCIVDEEKQLQAALRAYKLYEDGEPPDPPGNP